MTPAPRFTNVLYCGDVLDRITEIPDESVDLIYLDPPFFTNRNYEVVFGDEAEIRTFEDRWAGGILHYIEWMRERMIPLHRVLKPNGSIYFHCDPNASHYLKVMMDEVFRPRDFRNEVVWKRFSAKNDPKRFGRIHDVILFYTKGPKYVWNTQYGPFEEDYVEQNYRYVEEETGRRYRLSDLTANKPGGDTEYEWHGKRPYKGRYWAYSREQMDKFLEEGRIIFRRTGMPVYKRYLDEMPGVPLQDVWTDIRLHAGSKERLGYPTQKPEALLERIILASSNEGDIVLDPFCGCGTAIAVAEKLRRPWIGIDIAPTAMKICEARLRELGASFLIIGMPESVESLLLLRPFEFQNWVINQIRGKPSPRKTADMGIDGYTVDGDPVQVKRSTSVGRGVVDSFQTAVGRAKKSRGFVIAGSFTRGAHEEAARARRETGIEIRLVPVGDLFDDRKMESHGILPARLFAAEPFIPRAVPEAKPSAEQLVISEVASEEQPLDDTGEVTPTLAETLMAEPRAAEQLASDLLEAAGIGRPPVRLEPILERLNIEMSARLGQQEDALLVPMTDPKLGRPTHWMVYYNPEKPEVRRRYTVAHEVGHVLLHGDEWLGAAARGGGGGRMKQRERDVEKFAAELLMPAQMVRAAVRQYGLNVDRLRALFLVSKRAMEIRLRELGLS